MSKRMTNGRFAKRRSPLLLGGSWLASFASLGLLYGAARLVLADFAAFRSCSSNASGLVVESCGKRSLNMGDLLLLALFFMAAALVVALFTAAWRMTRRIAV